jgi:hypothetical protein
VNNGQRALLAVGGLLFLGSLGLAVTAFLDGDRGDRFLGPLFSSLGLLLGLLAIVIALRADRGSRD